MRKLAMAMVVVAFAAGPALGSECPLLQQQIDREVGNRFDAGAHAAKALAGEARALHQKDKHAEAIAKYEEAAKAAGIQLARKK